VDTWIARSARADPDVLFRLAAAVEDWPRLLPHYRWVRILSSEPNGRRTVEMAARRPWVGHSRAGVPLRWTALQTANAAERRVWFEHVAGPTRGMRVTWTIQPHADGTVQVGIRHVFEPTWPLPDQLVHWVVGEYFVGGVAARTLEHLIRVAENAVVA